MRPDTTDDGYAILDRLHTLANTEMAEHNQSPLVVVTEAEERAIMANIDSLMFEVGYGDEHRIARVMGVRTLPLAWFEAMLDVAEEFTYMEDRYVLMRLRSPRKIGPIKGLNLTRYERPRP